MTLSVQEKGVLKKMKKSIQKCTFCNKEIDLNKINVFDNKEHTITCEDCFFTDDWLCEDIDD